MTIFIFGEAMLEYHSHGGSGGLRYGGDTLNTAIHMARAGLDVAYVTAVGSDPISDALVAAWAEEGVDTRHVLRHPERSPGIYAIHVDGRGERSFLYWRERSAARDMFALPDMAEVLARARQASLLYYSLISLAILPPAGRSALLGLAASVREAGGKVAYDSNFRPQLWPSLDEARRYSQLAMASCDIGLPTNVDECELAGSLMEGADIASRWRQAGCSEVVVKAGEHGCTYSDTVTPPRNHDAQVVDVVDSSGAGDGFNAGYLASRHRGDNPEAALHAGQQLAAWVIGKKGAIPKRE